MTYKFIAIEGLDGSGKSTVARRLAKKLDGVFCETPPREFAKLRRLFDPPDNIATRFLFYLTGVACASDQIRQLLTTSHVVCARYVASTVSYHRALGLGLEWDLGGLNLLKPDYTFMLVVKDEQVRRERVTSRGNQTMADSLVEDDILRTRIIEEYSKYPMIEVDTTGITIPLVVEKLRSLITT